MRFYIIELYFIQFHCFRQKDPIHDHLFGNKVSNSLGITSSSPNNLGSNILID